MQPASALLLLALASLIAGCTNTLGQRESIGGARAGKPADCPIDVYRTEPTRPYVKVARLDTHLETTYFFSPSLDDALTELKRQACLSGADALMEIRERSSGYLETRSYHVTAAGIAFQ
jgi:hypothetical protein